MGAPELTRREADVLVALCRPLGAGDVVGQPASVREIAAVQRRMDNVSHYVDIEEWTSPEPA